MIKKHLGRQIVLLCIFACIFALGACSFGDGTIKETDVATTVGQQTKVEAKNEKTSSEEWDETTKEQKEATSNDDVQSGTDTSGGLRTVVGISLEETGSFNSDESMTVLSEVPVIKQDDGYSLVSINGEISSETYADIDYIEDGYCVFTKQIADVNNSGLITLAGEKLIPCECAIISWVQNKTGVSTGRFLRCIYGTEQTENEDEAFFYSTSNLFSLWAGEDDILYKGYAKIFDTVNKQFVMNLEITNPDKYSVYECGESILYEDNDGTWHLFDCEGKELFEYNGNIVLGNGWFAYRDNSFFKVFDDKGEKLFETEASIYDIDSTSGYLVYTDSDYKQILADKNGNKVLDSTYDSIYREKYGLIEATKGDKRLVVDTEGNELISSLNSFSELQPGYYQTEMDGGYELYGEDGLIAKYSEYMSQDLFVEKENKILVLNDKQFSLEVDADSVSYRSDGMFIVSDSGEGFENRYSLYEVYNGTCILKDMHEIKFGDEYVFAKTDANWTIYRVKKQYKNGNEVVEEFTEEKKEVQQTTAEEQANALFRHGKVDDSSYINDSLGFGFKLPDGWTIESDEELAQRNSIELNGRKYEDVLLEELSNNPLMEMFAEGGLDGNVNINVSTGELVGILEDGKLSMKQYVKTQVPQIESSLKLAGIENAVMTSDDDYDFPFDDYACYDVTGKMFGIDMFYKIVMLCQDKCIINITATSFDADSVNSIMDRFYKLDQSVDVGENDKKVESDIKAFVGTWEELVGGMVDPVELVVNDDGTAIITILKKESEMTYEVTDYNESSSMSSAELTFFVRGSEFATASYISYGETESMNLTIVGYEYNLLRKD